MKFLSIFFPIFLHFNWANAFDHEGENTAHSVEENEIDTLLKGRNGLEHWHSECRTAMSALQEFAKLKNESRSMIERIERAFSGKQPDAFYSELTVELMELIYQSAESGYEFIVSVLSKGPFGYLLSIAEQTMHQEWKNFMEYGANSDRVKSILLQYLYIAQLVDMLDNNGDGQALLYNEARKLAKEFAYDLSDLFQAYLARWMETQILAKLEPELLPWAIGRCELKIGEMNMRSLLPKFAVRISLLYPIYPDPDDERGRRDEEEHRQNPNNRGTNFALTRMPRRERQWFELMEAYLRPTIGDKSFKEVAFELHNGQRNLDEIIDGMLDALNYWHFYGRTGLAGPEIVKALIKTVNKELKNEAFMRAIKKMVVKNAKERQQIEVISFYIRFYRHILAEYTADSMSNMYPWLKRVVDYVLPYEHLATAEMIAQNEGNNGLEMLMALLIPPHKNAHFNANLYKNEPKSMKERSLIYGKIFAKTNTFEESHLKRTEKIKFIIRNSVLPLLESTPVKEGESSSSSFTPGKHFGINFAAKKSKLLELCAPMKNENFYSEENEEIKNKFIENAYKNAQDCLDFLIKDGLLEKAIQTQAKMGKTWKEVFGTIRAEMLSWGGENPLLEKLDEISGEFPDKFERIEAIKILTESEKKLIQILFIFTGLFRRMHNGLEYFVEEKLIGENGKRRKYSVLKAFLVPDLKMQNKRDLLAKIL